MRTFFLIVIVFTLSNCTQKDTTLKPENTVLSFLKWYKDNGQGIANDLVLNIGIKDRDSTKFYAVNFPATENYLNTLKKTSMISDKYAKKWREYFRKCDQNFKYNPTNEGPPVGFDYDFITFSQEDPGLNALDKAKLTLIKSDEISSTVLIQFPSTYQYKYHLTKLGQHWQIDNIENVVK